MADPASNSGGNVRRHSLGSAGDASSTPTGELRRTFSGTNFSVRTAAGEHMHTVQVERQEGAIGSQGQAQEAPQSPVLVALLPRQAGNFRELLTPTPPLCSPPRSPISQASTPVGTTDPTREASEAETVEAVSPHASSTPILGTADFTFRP
ncbi:MAG: hypothetical protein ACRC9R_00775, partial [Enterovibrio sp.]